MKENSKITGEPEEHYAGGETKTLKQLKADREVEGEDFPLPGFFPFLQLDLGLKAKISRHFHFLISVGVWDGFLVRGGLSLRLCFSVLMIKRQVKPQSSILFF